MIQFIIKAKIPEVIFINKKSKLTTRNIVFIGLFSAILAVTSQIAIPFPSGIPVTLQTFSVALCGYFLGRKNAVISVIIYILTGLAGVPVFANFKSGISVLGGLTGGFITGFIFTAFFCGTSSCTDNKILSLLGGIIQFSLITETSFTNSALIVSVPYIAKDIISVIFAMISAKKLQSRINANSTNIKTE